MAQKAIQVSKRGFVVEHSDKPVTFASLKLAQAALKEDAGPGLPPPDPMWAAMNGLDQCLDMIDDCLQTDQPMDQGRLKQMYTMIQTMMSACQNDMWGDAGKLDQ